MHELSVLIATLGEHVVKPLVWPVAFVIGLTKIIAFINGARGDASRND